MKSEMISDGCIRDLLSWPRTTSPISATVIYDGQTELTLCVKFIDCHAVSALIRHRDDDYYRVDKVLMEWILPDAWKQKETIRDLLQWIEYEEAKHDRKTHVA